MMRSVPDRLKRSHFGCLRPNTRTLAVAVVLALSVVSSRARAQSSAELAAEAKFADGVRLMKEDHCDQALPSFRASQTLDPASGTLLDIGYCEARLGKTASAWLAYRQAVALAQTSGRPQHERIAREEIAKLEPDLAYLTVVIPADARLEAELDGSPLVATLWSVSMPVDPGQHEVRILRGGRLRWQRSVSIAARERTSLDVPRSELESSDAPGQNPTVAVPSSSPGAPAISQTVLPEPAYSARRSPIATTLTLASAGVGVAGLVIASVLLGGARHDYDSVASECPDNRCTTVHGYSTREDAIRQFHWSLGVAGGSVAFLGTAAILWFASSPSGSERQGNSLSFGTSAKLGVSWHGRF